MLEDLAALVVDELELRLAARQRARQATELNDDVVQQLALLKLALDLGRVDQALEVAGQALESSKRILAELATDASTLRRS